MGGLQKCERAKCGTIERPSERWWRVLSKEGEFSVRPHDPAMPRRMGEQLVCGEACSTRLQAEWMTAEQGRQREKMRKRQEVTDLERMIAR